MEKHLNVLAQALNKANKEGAFNLQESAMVAHSLEAITNELMPKANPIEKAREEARLRNKNNAEENSCVKELVVKSPVEVSAEKPQEKGN